MKRFLTFTFGLVLIFSLAGCGKENSPAANNGQSSAPTQSPVSGGPSVLDFANLGIQIELKGDWLDLKDNIITLTAEENPVRGVMVYFSNDEAQAAAKALTDQKDSNKSEIEEAIWHNCKKLFTIVFVKTGEVSVDEIAGIVGGSGKQATVTELTKQGDSTFYFCTFPDERASGLTSVSKEKYQRLIKDIDTAKDNITTSAPKEPAGIDSGDSVIFTTTDLDGNTVSSDIFKDHKLTMINIWGSFCNPCIEEMPTLQKLNDEMEDKNVAIVGVLGDAMGSDGKPDEDTIDLAKSIIKEEKVAYLNLAMNGDLDVALPIDVYPTTVFVDSNGSVIGAAIHGAQDEATYRQAIQDALDKPSK